ncbi:hypothetical protein TUM17574_47340 [Klebsiella pneumoniae]|nr:hypothetical protein TUM16656_45310 [Klebsiella pneumoniae]GJK26609.1 hypothetical protein TUM17555_42840 [Klebsiella pneumoniae]GJK79277.1 hypothetical protein TUM17566_13290 [Klebsiella pneumoniae]GJL26358.1 hypothetical protein TUM17574_47340 [Klebsiella pneumoniae]
MTITLQAVNELIATLESAGELSIREQKFLKLAKAYQQLAAENVAMRETIDAVRGVADNSSGIAGWHLNGDIAKWSEILPEIDDIEAPATDRIVAGIKADGVEEWVSSRGGRWNGTTAEALKFAKQLRDGGK